MTGGLESGLRYALTRQARSYWARREEDWNVETEIRRCADLGIRLILRGAPEYPPLLASIPDPPAVLYVQGTISSAATLALVGSRRPTAYGLRMARRLAADASRQGIVTVSGLARGIDTEVHRASLDAGGKTWAVVGCGLDLCYPPENRCLSAQILAQGGAVLSEAPLGTRPCPSNFPRRNRIISGLAFGVVVVEGDVRSGSLITARRGLEQGREVFAVPGPADSPLSEGPNRLIADGAAPACDLRGIVDALPPLKAARVLNSPAVNLGEVDVQEPTAEGKKVLQWIGFESMPLEELLRFSGWSVQHLTEVLSSLELDGSVVAQPGQCYARKI